MGLSRTVSEINGGFGRKLQIFPNLVYLAPRERSFPWIFFQKKLAHAPIRRWKQFDDMWIRLDTIPECDGRTDGRICQR